MQGLRVAIVHRPRSKGRRRTPLRDARAHDDEFHNAQTTGQKGRNVNDYRDCPKCEKLKDENQKTNQSLADAKAQLGVIKRWNRASLAGGVAIACAVGTVAWLLGNLIHADVVKPRPCFDSAEIVDRDSYRRSCEPGAKLTVTPLQVADKVLVRCECGTNAVKDVGQ